MLLEDGQRASEQAVGALVLSQALPDHGQFAHDVRLLRLIAWLQSARGPECPLVRLDGLVELAELTEQQTCVLLEARQTQPQTAARQDVACLVDTRQFGLTDARVAPCDCRPDARARPSDLVVELEIRVGGAAVGLKCLTIEI